MKTATLALTLLCTALPSQLALAANPEQVIETYTNIAHGVYNDSYMGAQGLLTANQQLINEPNEQNLMLAREAWLKARVSYQQSEVFRFGNPIVDDWEGQLNAWPLDEGMIDYVVSDYQHELGNPGATANIIASQQIQQGDTSIDTSTLTPELLASLNELAGSEANVASGYHAIEFLLWGQDLNGTNPGAGERPYTDFASGDQCSNNNCQRRGEYLLAASELLVNDLNWMQAQWAVDGEYRQQLKAESTDQAMRRILFGMGSLSLGELAGERMKVALEANSTEDEHDCFSDNTHNSHFYNNKGINNVFFGRYQSIDNSTLEGVGIYHLVKQKDPTLAASISKSFAESEARQQAIVDSAEKQGIHFDQLIAASNQQGHELINEAIDALVKQTEGIEQAAASIGITELNPDNADHQFN